MSLLPDDGLVEGFEGVSDQVAVFAFVGLDFSGGGLENDREGGGSTEQPSEETRGDFDASDGGDAADGEGLGADHEPGVGHRDVPAVQKSGFVQHGAGIWVDR